MDLTVQRILDEELTFSPPYPPLNDREAKALFREAGVVLVQSMSYRKAAARVGLSHSALQPRAQKAAPKMTRNYGGDHNSLTFEQHTALIRDYKADIAVTTLATKYGISLPTAYRYLNLKPHKQEDLPAAEQLLPFIEAGISTNKIAIAFGLSSYMVNKIVNSTLAIRTLPAQPVQDTIIAGYDMALTHSEIVQEVFAIHNETITKDTVNEVLQAANL